MTEFSSYPPPVEEVIEALHETPGYDDKLPIAFKRDAITGPKTITEDHYARMSEPFSSATLGLVEIIELVGDLVYPGYNERNTDEALQAEVTAYVNSTSYITVCKSWRMLGKTHEEIVRSFNGWKATRERARNDDEAYYIVA